jgi:hypothetical protein
LAAGGRQQQLRHLTLCAAPRLQQCLLCGAVLRQAWVIHSVALLTTSLALQPVLLLLLL